MINSFLCHAILIFISAWTIGLLYLVPCYLHDLSFYKQYKLRINWNFKYWITVLLSVTVFGFALYETALFDMTFFIKQFEASLMMVIIFYIFQYILHPHDNQVCALITIPLIIGLICLAFLTKDIKQEYSFMDFIICFLTQFGSYFTSVFQGIWFFD
jgi:hypothetical protein